MLLGRDTNDPPGLVVIEISIGGDLPAAIRRIAEIICGDQSLAVSQTRCHKVRGSCRQRGRSQDVHAIEEDYFSGGSGRGDERGERDFGSIYGALHVGRSCD